MFKYDSIYFYMQKTVNKHEAECLEIYIFLPKYVFLKIFL